MDYTPPKKISSILKKRAKADEIDAEIDMDKDPEIKSSSAPDAKIEVLDQHWDEETGTLSLELKLGSILKNSGKEDYQKIKKKKTPPKVDPASSDLLQDQL